MTSISPKSIDAEPKSLGLALIKVTACVVIFLLSAHVEYVPTLANYIQSFFPKNATFTLLGAFVIVPIIILPFFLIYRIYIDAARKIVDQQKNVVVILMFLFLLTYLTMSSTYWLKAENIFAALLNIYEIFFKENWLLIGLFFSLTAFLAYYFCGQVLISQNKADFSDVVVKSFAGSGVFLWILFLFMYGKSEDERYFLENFPNVSFDLAAHNFVWYSFHSFSVLAGLLWAVKFNPYINAKLAADIRSKERAI
jgi:hypothetical protein